MGSSTEHGTRERILEVAEAFLGERGYDGTRLHLIAQQVGIQKASLFHYFPSKEELYRAVLKEGFGETEQTLRRVIDTEGGPLEKVCALVEAYVDMVAAHPERTKILLRQSLGDAPHVLQHVADSQRLLGLVVGFVAEGQRNHVFAQIDPLALVLSVVGMVAFFFTSAHVLAPVWIDDPSNPSAIERVKRHVVDVVQRCLSAGDEHATAAELAIA